MQIASEADKRIRRRSVPGLSRLLGHALFPTESKVLRRHTVGVIEVLELLLMPIAFEHKLATRLV